MCRHFASMWVCVSGQQISAQYQDEHLEQVEQVKSKEEQEAEEQKDAQK